MVILVSAWSLDAFDNDLFELITVSLVVSLNASLSVISLPFVSGADF